MSIITGLSGNEIYCLKQKNFEPGNLVIGNSVFALGFVNSIGSGFSTLVGGEVEAVTRLVHDGRQQSYQRMMAEAKTHGGIGVTGISSDLVFHGTNIEFLSIGSTIHNRDVDTTAGNIFSASADGQELYCQVDCGFQPIKFVFGNVAYSIGVGGGIIGGLRSLGRGEVKEYSNVFNHTRHLALERIVSEARTAGANAVLGIQTSILPIGAMQEMLMIGTATKHDLLPSSSNDTPISSDLTSVEMWNLMQTGYCPIKLMLGVSVFSVGFIGGISAFMKGFVRGEISELTTLIYEARENALNKISEEAAQCGADDVVGIKTYVYDLGGGIIELMAIGTAIKKTSELKPASTNLIVQAVVKDAHTFYNSAESSTSISLNEPTRNMRNPFLVTILVIIYIVFVFFTRIMSH
jgi:uncharacterized protein YbjQ (UPF0145 family)